jgi:mRNA interferase MazF
MGCVNDGINVGCEIYGKGSNYVRPVLVINDDGEDNFIGVPLTSKIQNIHA